MGNGNKAVGTCSTPKHSLKYIGTQGLIKVMERYFTLLLKMLLHNYIVCVFLKYKVRVGS